MFYIMIEFQPYLTKKIDITCIFTGKNKCQENH
jgi:hypothetical protein